MRERTEIKWHHDGASLIDMLDKTFPPVRFGVNDLSGEEGRLRLAWELGQRTAIKAIKAALADNKSPSDIVVNQGLVDITIEDLSTERGRLSLAGAAGSHNIYEWLLSLKEKQNDSVLRRRSVAGADSQGGTETLGR